MDYPFSERNWVCRWLGHRYDKPYRDYDQDRQRTGTLRQTCSLDGHTVPPFRKLAQVPPFDYLPDDQQPPGAV